MMEEVQTIFAVGAGAVTKLVRENPEDDGKYVIKRLFRPKYPYEYLNEDDRRIRGEKQREEILEFFK
jgi:hypothetical protein